MKPESLWVEVIDVVHFSTCNKRLIPIKMSIVGVWKDIGSVEGSLMKKGINMSDKLSVKVGNESRVHFWSDRWAAENSFAVMFPDLIRLAADKSASVAEWAESYNTGGTMDILVRGPNPGEEEQQLELHNNVLMQVHLNSDRDVWSWENNDGTLYSTKQVRGEIDAAVYNGQMDPVFYWNSWAPLKSNYLLWRVLDRRVASKIELARRGVIGSDVLCSRCRIHDEDTEHVFVRCIWSLAVWWNVLSCLRIPWPDGSFFLTGWYNYLFSRPGSKKWKRIVHMVVLATTWRIWNARNSKTFEDKFVPVHNLVDLIKEDSYLWIVNRSKLLKAKWEDWVSFSIANMV